MIDILQSLRYSEPGNQTGGIKYHVRSPGYTIRTDHRPHFFGAGICERARFCQSERDLRRAGAEQGLHAAHRKRAHPNGYLERDTKGNYSLSFKTYEIGIRAVRRVDHITFIRETLDQMAEELGVVAQFSVREHTELLCLESFDPTKSNFSVYTRVGQRSELYATSAGKAILSTYPDAEIEELWKQMNVRVFTPKTITTLDAFMQRIYEARQRGFALDDEESEMGLFCVGTPLLNANKHAIGAISLSTNRMDGTELQRLSSALLTQTQRLSYMLSYSAK